jgi:predicted aconitase
VEVEADLRDDFQYQLLGYCVPKKAGPGVPVFTGLPGRISPEALMNLGAQLNTAGAVSMYHIVGVTPEAPTVDAAFKGEAPLRTIVITDRDLKNVHKDITAGRGKIEFAMFGCHCPGEGDSPAAGGQKTKDGILGPDIFSNQGVGQSHGLP